MLPVVLGGVALAVGGMWLKNAYSKTKKEEAYWEPSPMDIVRRMGEKFADKSYEMTEKFENFVDKNIIDKGDKILGNEAKPTLQESDIKGILREFDGVFPFNVVKKEQCELVLKVQGKTFTLKLDKDKFKDIADIKLFYDKLNEKLEKHFENKEVSNDEVVEFLKAELQSLKIL